MEKLVETGKLFSIYEDLLTDRQKNILSQYVDEDCSLSEISERENISRQGVRDSISKSIESLNRFDCVLGLSKKYDQLEKALSKTESVDGSNLEELRDAYSLLRKTIQDVIE